MRLAAPTAPPAHQTSERLHQLAERADVRKVRLLRNSAPAGLGADSRARKQPLLRLHCCFLTQWRNLANNNCENSAYSHTRIFSRPLASWLPLLSLLLFLHCSIAGSLGRSLALGAANCSCLPCFTKLLPVLRVQLNLDQSCRCTWQPTAAAAAADEHCITTRSLALPSMAHCACVRLAGPNAHQSSCSLARSR